MTRYCCARPTGRARIGTHRLWCLPHQWSWLRPAYGSGEDWNKTGVGNDFSVIATWGLRPAYGSGEDWNYQVCAEAAVNWDAPGLPAGRGLERAGP
jgi:hypothetical protein